MGLAIGDILSIQLHGRILNQKTISTFFYKVISASTEQNDAVALKAVGDSFTVGILSPGLSFIQAAPQNWTAVETRVQRVYPALSQYVIDTVGLPGTVGSDAEAPNIMATITRRGAAGGRRNIGALHSAPLPSDGFADGLITNTHKTRLETVATRMLNDFTVTLETTQLTPILWSRAIPSDGQRRVSSTIVQNEVRTMRRRTLGLGI